MKGISASCVKADNLFIRAGAQATDHREHLATFDDFLAFAAVAAASGPVSIVCSSILRL